MTFLTEKNLEKIKNEINMLEEKYSRYKNSVKLLAVSKAKSIELIQLAYKQGQNNFGENYLQEALEKIENLRLVSPAIIWHFIGRLQSNKAKLAAQNFDWIQTVDSLKLAEKLSHFRLESQPKLNICIQVNITAEPKKSGVSLGEVSSLAEKIMQLPKLKLRGLMAIGFADMKYLEENKRLYQDLNKVFQDLKLSYLSIDTLSIGMSQDLELAIANGSTMVRVGRAIFGEREL